MRIRKLLTILLTMVMVVSLLPATAFAANNTATTMRLAKTQGTVTVTNATGKNVKQTGNMKLYNGYKVKTGAKSYVWISLDDTKVAKLDANSVMEVQKQGKNLALYLSSGNMFFNVKDPLKSGETFSIKTSTMTTGIRGTSGCVRVISPRVTEIHLLTGEVQVYAEHPVLALSKTATLKAGQKATSLIDWEAIAATGEMVEILIERLENHEICGVCSKEIANDPALLERIEREAPHLLPEKAAAEADERLAADEVKAEEKQAAIEKAVEEQVFPEDVDPYFEEKEGGGGGGSAAVTPSQIVNVATWAELLKAITDYNNAAGITQINLTASIPTDAELEEGQLAPLPEIKNMNALTLHLDEYTLSLNGTLVNDADLTITNAEGYIIGNGSSVAVQNKNILTLRDGQIDGNGQTAVLNSAGTFYMYGGELLAPARGSGNMQPPALNNMTGARAYLYGGAIFGTDAAGLVGVQNSGTLTVSGATLQNLNKGVLNQGTASMTSGLIDINGIGVDNQGSFRITGGQIAATRDYTTGILMTAANADTQVMDNAVITVSGYGSFGIQAGAGTLNISGGTVSAETASTEETDEVAGVIGSVAVGVDSESVSVSVTTPALIRAKAESDVFNYASDEQWPVNAFIIDDTENSGYWRLLLPQGGEAPPYNPPDDPEPDVPVEDENLIPVETAMEFIEAVLAYDHEENLTLALSESITVDSRILMDNGVPALAVADSGDSTYKLTIDLMGNELNLPDIVFENNGNLVLMNSVKGGGIKVGALDGTNNAGIKNNGGSLTLDGAPIYVYSGYGVYSTDPNEAPNINASFTMDSGMITTEAGTGLKVDKGAVNLNGGEITAEGGTAVDFTGMNPAVSGGFGTEIKANVERGTEDVYLPSLPTGYEFVRNDTYYVLKGVTTVTADAFLGAVDSYEGTADEVVKLYEDTAVTAETLAAVGLETTGLVSDPEGEKTLTIDLAGKTLTLNAPLVNEGSMIITDSLGGGQIVNTAAALGDRMIQNTGALTLEKGTMTVPHGAIGVDNSGTFNMTGGSMDVIYTTGIQNSSIVNLNGGTITMPQKGAPEGVTEETAIAYAAYMQTGEDAELTMAGTQITVEKNIEYTHTDGTSSAVCAVYIEESGSATMEAGTITVGTDTGISNRGTLNFESGKIIVDGGADASSNTTGIETFGTLTMGSNALVEVARGRGILIGADTTLSAGKVNTTLMEYTDETGGTTLEDWAPEGIYVYGGQTTLTLDGVDIEAHAGVGVALASGKTNFGSGTSIAAYNTAGAVSLIEVDLASTVTRPVASTITWAYDSDFAGAAEEEIDAEYAMDHLFGLSDIAMSCTGPVASGDYNVYTLTDNYGNVVVDPTDAITAQEFVERIEAFNVSGSDATITLGADITIPYTAETSGEEDVTYIPTVNNSSHTLTIDTNGYTLTLGTTLAAKTDMILTGGRVTGDDNFYFANGGGIEVISGKTTLNGALIGFNDPGDNGENITGFYVAEDAELLVTNGGTFILATNRTTMIENHGKTTIEGGGFEANNSNMNAGIPVKNYGDLTVENGRFVSSYNYAIWNAAGSTMEMNGGRVSTYGIYAGVYLQGSTTDAETGEPVDGAEATLKGGAIEVTSAGGDEKGVEVGPGATLTLNGATITVKGHTNYSANNDSYGIYDRGGAVTINSGSITATNGATEPDTGRGNAVALYSTGWNELTVDTDNATVQAQTQANVISPTFGRYGTNLNGEGTYYVLRLN